VSYSFIHDVPINEEMYAKIRAELGDIQPEGLIAHVVIRQPQGLRYVDVWKSQADWDRFHADQLEPVVGRVLGSYGITPDPSMAPIEQIDVIDTLLGAG